MDELNQVELQHRLSELQMEHRDLDAALGHLSESQNFDQIQRQRMKKRKLALKDQIAAIEAQLVPDIIA